MGRSHGAIGLENVRIRRPHEHGSAGGLESFNSGDQIQKVADSGTQSARFVWTEGRSDNISFRQSRFPKAALLDMLEVSMRR